MSNDPQSLPDFDALDILMPEGAPAPRTADAPADHADAKLGLAGFDASQPEATAAWTPDTTLAMDAPLAANAPLSADVALSPDSPLAAVGATTEPSIEEQTEEKEPKPKKPGLFSKLQKTDPYTALLGVALVCITLGCLFLVLAWQRYGFERKPPRSGFRTTSISAPAEYQRLV